MIPSSPLHEGTVHAMCIVSFTGLQVDAHLTHSSTDVVVQSKSWCFNFYIKSSYDVLKSFKKKIITVTNCYEM